MQKLIVFLLLAPYAGLAQVSIAVSGGFGSWSMKSMKEWQQEYKNTFPVEAKTLVSFPPHWFFEASAMQKTDQWIRGLAVSNGSTGGRSYYSDYSGSIRFDQSLSFYMLSGIIGRTLNRDGKKFVIVGEIRPAVMLSKMSYDYEQRIYGDKTEDIYNTFTSLNFTVQPSLSVIRKFGAVGLEALVGYQLAIVSGKMTYDDETKIPPDQLNVDYLILEDKGPVTSNWSGFRLALGINYTF